MSKAVRRILLLLTGSGLILTLSVVSHAGDGPILNFGPERWLQFGLRSQWKYEYTQQAGNNDMMLRRNRLKMEGSLLEGTKFKMEGKLDDVGRDGHNSRAEMEDVSLFLNSPNSDRYIRIGLYDAPLSRDRLTSDHRLLLADRSDLSEAFNAEGLADNTIGIQLSGYPTEHLEYHVGVYDNETWGDATKQLMPMGRCVLQLLEPERGEYDATYPEGGKNMVNLGASIGYLDEIMPARDTYSLLGYEADLFVILKCGFVFQAEYGRIHRDNFDSGALSIISEGWYLQTGYRLPWEVHGGLLEFAYRYQEYNPELGVPGDLDRKNSIGANYYWIGHTMKLQTDYTLIDRQGRASDGVYQIQFQIDF